MLFDILSGGDMRLALITLLLTVPTVLISLTFHEVAHGYVAYKLGDPTAYNLGRLTLNPLAHLDPIGALMMLLVGFGYAKPVPINAGYFKNPKYGMAISAAAGPITNLILGLVATILMYTYAWNLAPLINANIVLYVIYQMLFYFAYLNFALAIFNMIPLPPFDGSRVLFAFLPDRHYFGIMRYERYIMIAVLVLMSTNLFPFSAGNIAWAMIEGIGKIFGAIMS